MSLNDPLEPYYFKPEEEHICGQVVKPITEEFSENYPSVIDRFFTRYYHIKPGTDAAPYLVLFHSNRICLIYLAPDHPALAAGINSINFDVGNADRSKNCVKGKGKKGGMVLQADSTLALVTANDNKCYKVPSCIRGKLVEVNLELRKNPNKLHNCCEGEGYIAIVLPKPEHCEQIKASLLTEQQYAEYKAHKVASRSPNSTDENEAPAMNEC